LTLVGAFGIVYHLWRLRLDGGISRPPVADGEGRAFINRDDLFGREAVAAALVTAALLLLATFAPVPLGPAADLNGGPPVSVQAPWIFLWVQYLLRGLPPLWAGIIMPLLVLLALATLPLWDRRGPGRGRWFARERWRPQVLLGALAVVLIWLSVLEVWR
jgi:hypothetical protein